VAAQSHSHSRGAISDRDLLYFLILGLDLIVRSSNEQGFYFGLIRCSGGDGLYLLHSSRVVYTQSPNRSWSIVGDEGYLLDLIFVFQDGELDRSGLGREVRDRSRHSVCITDRISSLRRHLVDEWSMWQLDHIQGLHLVDTR